MSASGTAAEPVKIAPHKGPQEQILASPADIAFYGGQAGGGKSWALLLEGLRNTGNPHFGATIFRRTCPEITNPGGLWDESTKLYPLAGGRPLVGALEWKFPSGARVTFRHLQHEKDRFAWQGTAVAMLGFDEVSHFTATLFWYLLSRNRSTSGVRPYVRATTNPVDRDDPTGGWVRELVDWWIGPDGFAIPQRSGVVRWFARIKGSLVWSDSREELLARYPGSEPKSFTFVNAKLADNPTLCRTDPGYLANLQALPDFERAQLLDGNWNVRRVRGMVFKVDQIKVVDAAPENLRLCRAWDLAATEGAGDWSSSVKMGIADDGIIYIPDVWRGQVEADAVRRRIKQCAELDGYHCRVRLPQDPGQAGKDQAAQLTRMLAGWPVKSKPVSGDKITRASGFAAQVNAGNVRIVRAPWNAAYLAELDAFGANDGSAADDQVDASSDSFNELTAKKIFAVG